MEEATNLSVAISNMTIEEKQNTDIVKRIIQGDKLQLKRLTKKSEVVYWNGNGCIWNNNT